jgi:DNA-binding NarL/FixJ family response regulator
MVRILLADDHEVMRRGLHHLIEEQPGWELCAEAATGRQAVALAKEKKPDIAILDFSMPELNGLAATRQIKKAVPQTEVLVFTMHDDEHLVREVLAAGARGYLLKTDAARHIVAAVEALSRHKPFFTSQVSETMLESFLRHTKSADEKDSTGPITAREREIIQLLAEGKSNKNIATMLGISVDVEKLAAARREARFTAARRSVGGRKRQRKHALNHSGLVVETRCHFSVRRDRDERAHIRQS